MQRPLVIIGAGSQAGYIIDIINEQNSTYSLRCLVDIYGDAQPITGVATEILKLSQFYNQISPADAEVVVACGDIHKKKSLVDELTRHGFMFATIVSIRAYVSPSATVGSGTIINPNATVLHHAEIGEHVILHSGTVVEHDNVIGKLANLAPGVTLAGRVTIGTGAHIYTGSSILPDITVADWAVVGAGAVVTKNVPSKKTVVGIPGKEISAQ